MIKRIGITFLCLCAVCLLFACAEETVSQTESSDTSSIQKTFSETSALFQISDIPLPDETVIPSASDILSEAVSDHSAEESFSASSAEESPEESLETETSSSSDISTEESTDISDEEPVAHKVNGFIVYSDRGMEPFGGSASGGASTAEVFNAFKERVGEHVQVYAMPIPIASAFYAPEGYEGSINNHVNCFSGLRDALEDVLYVDLISALKDHTDEEIYARTDHHWNALGAYYAAKAFCETANAEFADLSQFEEYSFDGYLGSVYSAYGVSELKKYPETFRWYEPLQEYQTHYYSQNYTFSFTGTLFSNAKSYVKFIYGDSYIVRTETGIHNGRKLLIVKDSFGNALAPFMLAGFEEVYVVDFRDLDCNLIQFTEENGITDVVFALSAFSVATSKRDNITRLMNL